MFLFLDLEVFVSRIFVSVDLHVGDVPFFRCDWNCDGLEEGKNCHEFSVRSFAKPAVVTWSTSTKPWACGERDARYLATATPTKTAAINATPANATVK